jgi:hypothetical protein
MVDGIFLSQPKYTLDLLARFHMSDCKPSPTPFQSRVKLIVDCDTPLVDATLYCQLVGILIYLTHSRLDLSFVVSLVSKFMQNPHDIAIGKQLKGFSYIFKELYIMVSSIQARLLFHFLVTPIMIG